MRRPTHNGRATRGVVTALVLAVLVVWPPRIRAQHGRVALTVHNLSVSGPGEVRAAGETQVCKFCHIPHNAVVPAPLWSRSLSNASYKVADLRDAKLGIRPAPQPDGSSRLCLSCHDGTIALGEIGSSGQKRVSMAGASRIEEGRRGFLGTDLSGSHPVSIVVSEVGADLDANGRDMGLRTVAQIQADPDVRLDERGKMQCTSCHDPHSDLYFQEGKVPRFWVKPTVEEVCLVCHELR